MNSEIRPCIALTTDFGMDDPYVGIMKGVIFNIAPAANIVDVTHEIDPCDIQHAALVLKSSYSFFPRGTIHLVVVDPGVGSQRRPILVVTRDFSFIAPDNGVLSPAISDSLEFRAYHLMNRRFFLQPLSNTFHGRDVFAPAAAWLCRGIPPSELGDEIFSIVESPFPTATQVDSCRWTGEILRIDRFGNLITNLQSDLLFKEGCIPPTFRINIGGREISRFCLSYAEALVGELFAISGSTGFLEISSNQTSAAKLLQVGRHQEVILELV